MSQGLFTTISGITNNQSMLDVIADNIANINTTGFKSSKITFETIFSRTLSSGSAPSSATGGINPKQVGLGVTLSDISKNFSRGSIQTTGRNSDLNIQGEGFFTLMDSQGKMFLSRAGNFSVDALGNLVNPQGLKVAGTDKTTSTIGGTTTVKVPTALVLDQTNEISDGTTTITPGDFTINVNGAGAQTITVLDTDTDQDIVNKINAQLSNSSATINASGNIVISGTDTVVLADGTSNFATVAAFAGAPPTYTSAALTNTAKVAISQADPANANYVRATSFSIRNDGSVEVTYSNGGRLTVTGEPTRNIKYITSGSQEVTGTDVTINGGAVTAAELQLQLANVINPKGLESVGGNLFSLNSIAGEPSFAIGRNGGLGAIESGGLEASNVDLTQEFANMILAQRGVEANSRTFEIQNQIMRTIVNMGR